MIALPQGIVTFLFTDIEGSSRLWEQDRVAMTAAVARHDAILADAVRANQGVPFKYVGDMMQAAFHHPHQAVAAAVAAQRALAAEPWPDTGPIRARMAIHLGLAAPDEQGDYNQIACLNRLSRLLSTGFGGQILLSDAVFQQISGHLPDGVMARDLGKHRLRDLLDPEQVTQLVIAGLPAAFPPLKSLEGHPTNLPAMATALLGREDDLARIAALLGDGDARLVTLVGPGGVGKSHLALQAAADLLDDFPDGVWLVRLGEVTDPGMILPAIAAVLGIREVGGLDLHDALVNWLAARRVLLILDNLEQVVSGSPVIARLLVSTDNLRILGTSRQRLGIAGEHLLAIDPLPVFAAPAASGESRAPGPAAQLFLERAREITPDIDASPATMHTIEAICTRLDGLPLAIELAASQLRTRTLSELHADLDSRFDLLVGGKREALDHQRSLAATIAWTYERLDGETQRLFCLLSPFAGGWPRDAVNTLTDMVDDPHGRLATLVEQSLIRRETIVGDVSRWSMLESIRSFARERLRNSDDATAAQERHAAWSLAVTQDTATALHSGEQVAALARLDLEHDNSRAALSWWQHSGNTANVLALAVALAPYWQVRGHLSEGRRWLEAALATTQPDDPERLAGTIEAGIMAQELSDAPAAHAHYTNALEQARQFGDQHREIAMLSNLGVLALERGDLAEAESRCSAALEIAERLGDTRRGAQVMGYLGAAAHYRGDLELALQRYLHACQVWTSVQNDQGAAEMLLNVLLLLAPVPAERHRAEAAGEASLRHFRALGDVRGEAIALSGLGLVAAVSGELARASDLYRRSLVIARQTEDRETEASALASLASVAIDTHELDAAQEHLSLALPLFAELDDFDGVALGLELSAAMHAQAAPHRATRLLGAASALRSRIGIPIHPESAQRHRAVIRDLTRQLGTQFERLHAEGALFTPDAAIAEALRAASQPHMGEAPSNSRLALDTLLGMTSKE
jgi:predicted ATPase